VAVTPAGVTLLHCFGGCETATVLTMLNLTFADLAPGQDGWRRPSITDPVKAAVATALQRARRRQRQHAPLYAAADRIRQLQAAADRAHTLASQLGPEHPGAWSFVKVATDLSREADYLEVWWDDAIRRRPRAA
jgi:hypothetical protein